ncbi:GNAT family N-acetyltransferase [Pseudarthrobacter sp. J1763]|uniref:GNAT family N-acetyltransferase n=1 Tax=Pseudarthrobacter sp. J1763 TaxID=3420445 RepID=UPI003D2D17F6
MTASDELLAAYDAQLRTDAETPSALTVKHLGALRLVTFSGGRGFITYQDLAGADRAQIERWVPEALDYYSQNPAIAKVEWKTRGHDHAPGLHEALLANGFIEEEPESIMIGAASALAVEVPLPEGITLRRVTKDADIRAMCAMQDLVFGEEPSAEYADAIVARAHRDPLFELWVADHAGEIVSAGRLEPVPGTDFAGIWGGCTVESWRGQGIYRALTAARASSALAQGYTLIHSDSTGYSRPILERYGFTKVSTTTPYVWKR